ncbi:MAG: hypothetical protein JWN55_2248, partial [Frankiales bacterium]|nr:hypothetical protein [Frankiales bacterium]
GTAGRVAVAIQEAFPAPPRLLMGLVP